MKKTKIDEIRERTGIKELSEKEKKEMFKKFVEAGGRVVNLDEEERKNILVGKRSGRGVAIATQRDETEVDGKNKAYSKRIVKLERSKAFNPFNRWIEKFSSRIDCFVNGILTFSGKAFAERFRKLFLVDFQNALLGSRMILASVLYQDKFASQEIKKKLLLDNTFPYYYELIYRYDNIYTEERYEVIERMRFSLDIVEDLRPVIMDIFKDIMILQPYFVSLKSAIEKALWLEKELRGINSTVYFENLHKLNGYVDFVFNKVYPKLFILVDYFYRDRTNLRKKFREFLNFGEQDTLGYYTFNWKKELLKSIKEEEKKGSEQKEKIGSQESVEEVKEEAQEVSNVVAEGIKLIVKNINPLKSLKQYLENKDLRAIFSPRDKVFLSFLVLDYFDKEFSFIFTSNKVEIGIAFIEGNRMDLRKELTNIYYRVNGIFERVDEYLKVIKEIKKIENDSFLSFQEKTGRLNQYSIERSQLSRMIRRDMKNLFDEFSNKLLYLISDYNGERKILQNPEDIMEFDVKIDGERFSNGKKVIDIIEAAYKFCSGALFLLSDADLGGLGIFLEKPIYLNFDLSGEGNV
ncbi:MAG: hypothetical protein ACP5QT_01780 [Brevinematia bacterium]